MFVDPKNTESGFVEPHIKFNSVAMPIPNPYSMSIKIVDKM
jgi:hypothetical protein